MKFKSVLATGLSVALLSLGSKETAGAVTPYSWIRLGEGGSLFADSSGQNHPFNAGFSTGFGGDPGAVILPTAAGGPLGGTAAISSLSARFGYYSRPNGGMWIQGPGNTVPTAAQWSLAPTNWVAEAWVMPVDGRQTSEIFNTGTGHFGGTPGGIAFRTRIHPETGEHVVRLDSIGPVAANQFQIGDEATLLRSRFTHIAAVNDNGTVTFYVNGVATGAPATANTTAPSGIPYIGSGQDTGNPFWGFIDEVRYSTFAPGAFVAATDLLLLPPGASIISQPQSVTVWEGAPAIFKVVSPVDDRTTYQWKVGSDNVVGATSPELIVPSVVAADSGKVYTVVVSNSGVDKTSDPATLTVKAPETANNAFFRESINAEASLIAYFTMDGDTVPTVTNVKDNTRNATITGVGDFDGRTNRAYGVKSLRLQQSGHAGLAPNPAFEFADGTGSIEAVIYLASGAAGPVAQNIFAVAETDAASVWQFQVSADGNSLIYRSDVSNNGVAWVVTPSLLNRLAHVALVFNGANVTAYVDGLSLGAKPNPGLGVNSGVSAFIGSAGEIASGFVGAFNGNIDEVAIYSDALSDTAIAIHNSRFLYGTAVSAPSITSAPTGTINVLAGGAPQFRVTASGTAPLSYQWKFNGQPIADNPSANTSVLTIMNSTVNSSGLYTVTVTNPQGSDTSAGVTVNFAPVPVGENYAAKVLADNPSAYYRLNETEGTTLVDSAGGLHGTYGAGVELGKTGAPGTTGTALRLPPGLTSITSVPYTPVMNPAGPYTIEFWAQPEVAGNTQGAILGTQNRNTGRAGYAVYQGFNGNWWEAHLGYQESVIFLQAQSTQPAVGRWDHVVVTWDGVGNSRIYVNGEIDPAAAAASTLSPTRPNLSQPFEIGSRFNGSARWRGTVDEIAFYNKALTHEEITNHFSVAWVAAAITSSPGNATAVEAGTLVLAGTASGYPNKYQWFKDGQPVANVAENPNHFGGITTPTLTINNITEADAGQYYLQVLNPLGDVQTTTATVTFARDTVKPAVTSVNPDSSLTRVRVNFSKPVDPTTALTAGNYVFTGGITAASVAATSDPAVVNVVLTQPMTAGATYSLTVSNVKDTRLDGNVVAANSNGFKAYVLTQGVLAVDVFTGFGGTSVASLTGSGFYPDGLNTNRTITNFSLDGWGDNYGVRVYGWVTPTVAGDYKFYIRSDDSSELWMSTDANPANAELIAQETGCCNGFAEESPRTATRTLAAGQTYFIQALMKEGGGGDYVYVAWRPPGDETAVGSLMAIPGTFLSAYAPVPRAQLTATLTGGQVVITWTGTGRLQESSDLATWTDVSGNPASGYSFLPAAGAGMRFFRITE